MYRPYRPDTWRLAVIEEPEGSELTPPTSLPGNYAGVSSERGVREAGEPPANTPQPLPGFCGFSRLKVLSFRWRVNER